MPVETFDMGEFQLPADVVTASDVDAKSGENPSKSLVNQTFKEVQKAAVKNKKSPNDETVKEHQEHVIMLSRYGSSKRFAEFLKTMGFNLGVDHLQKMETDKLKELLTRVKTSIDNKNVSNFWEELCFGAIQTGEMLVTATTLSKRVKLAGLTECLKQDESFLDLLEQVELENQNLVYASPYVRLVYTVTSTAMKCHAVNTMMEKNKHRSVQSGGETEIRATEEESKKPEKTDVLNFE